WAGLAPLEEGVAASGVVVVDNNRQQVQHLEGGIVREIKVRDGQTVEAGDVLVILQETVSLAGRDQVSQRAAALRASIIRLAALQSGVETLVFEDSDFQDVSDIERAKIVERERDLFEQQRLSQTAEVRVLQSRKTAALTNARLKTSEREITKNSRDAALEELKVVQGMFDRQLARRDEVIQLEREAARLEGVIARLTSEVEAERSSAIDFEKQIASVRASFEQQTSEDLRAASAELLSVEEQVAAAQDVLNRSVITAPMGGEVLNLNFTTEGGVVRPGETIMEIVPVQDQVTTSVRIRPVDRASLFEGQSVRTQVSAYRSWLSPSLSGEVVDVSADLKIDPATGAQYYEARIMVDADGSDLEIVPGMPVEVFIFSGKSRTTLDYLFEPIAASLFRGLRSS
ncbi:MAG: HlyD family type I secretion periplasmic adaptor subunit, partial [Pseudomonadota bacterium]